MDRTEYPRCRTCKHFTPEHYEDDQISYGSCAKLGESGQIAWIWSPDDDGRCQFHCLPYFGCIQHEERDDGATQG